MSGFSDILPGSGKAHSLSGAIQDPTSQDPMLPTSDGEEFKDLATQGKNALN